MTTEYFIVAHSFAAPFVSDESMHYIEADTPAKALERMADGYRHPTGLYSADAYASADAYHKNEGPLARWLCNHEIAKAKATAGSTYSYFGHGPGDFEVNGQRVSVADPKGGRVVPLGGAA
jgi:hypothetical protein